MDAEVAEAYTRSTDPRKEPGTAKTAGGCRPFTPVRRRERLSGSVSLRDALRGHQLQQLRWQRERQGNGFSASGELE